MAETSPDTLERTDNSRERSEDESLERSPETRPRLNKHEQKILQFLADEASSDFGYYGFAPLMQETGLDRKAVRKACRSLKRKGLTNFARGMWTDEGDPAGSGYGATKAGVEFIYGPRKEPT